MTFKERQVIQDYYVRILTMREIAKKRGLSYHQVRKIVKSVNHWTLERKAA